MVSSINKRHIEVDSTYHGHIQPSCCNDGLGRLSLGGKSQSLGGLMKPKDKGERKSEWGEGKEGRLTLV